MARPKGTARPKKPIQKVEYERLVNAAHKSLSIKASTRVKLIAAFTLLYLTGCRISEIININTNDIKNMILHNEYSLTNTTKTKTPRLISFDTNRMQIEFLQKILPPDDRYLFAKNNSQTPMSVSSLKLQMNQFIHRVLGPLYSTHSFRAGYITIAHKQGLSLEHIREDIGHESISTTARYATVTHKEIADAKSMREW